MKKRKNNNAEAQVKRFSIGMASPAIIVLAIMTAYPLIFTLVYSFSDYNLLKAMSQGVEVTGLKELYRPSVRQLFSAVCVEYRQVYHSDGYL